MASPKDTDQARLDYRKAAQAKRVRRNAWSALRPVRRTALYMLLMGIFCAWLASLAYPLATRIGLSEAVIRNLPGYGLFIGLGAGLAMGLSNSAKEMGASVFAVVILGGVFWFCGVLAGGLLIGIGLPESVADWAPRAGFAFGALLGAVIVFAVAQDKFHALLVRTKGVRTGGRSNSASG